MITPGQGSEGIQEEQDVVVEPESLDAERRRHLEHLQNAGILMVPTSWELEGEERRAGGSPTPSTASTLPVPRDEVLSLPGLAPSEQEEQEAPQVPGYSPPARRWHSQYDWDSRVSGPYSPQWVHDEMCSCQLCQT